MEQLSNRTASVYLRALPLTGARREELAALAWANVDFQWRKLTIADKVDSMGAFQAGFGMGQQAFNTAMEAARLEKLDAQNAELIALRKLQMEGDLRDKQQLREDDAVMRQAGAPAVASSGAAVTGPDGKAFMQADMQGAQAAIDQAKAEGDTTDYQPAQASNVKMGGAGSRSFLGVDGGLAAAAQYATGNRAH